MISPCSPYHTPAEQLSQAQKDPTKAEQELDWLFAVTKGDLDTTGRPNFPSVRHPESTLTLAADPLMAGFHEDMELTRQLLNGEVEWVFPEGKTAHECDPSEYRLVKIRKAQSDDRRVDDGARTALIDADDGLSELRD